MKQNHSRPLTIGDACLRLGGPYTPLTSTPRGNEVEKAEKKARESFEEKVEHLTERQIKAMLSRCLEAESLSTFNRLWIVKASKKNRLSFLEKVELSKIYISTKNT